MSISVWQRNDRKLVAENKLRSDILFSDGVDGLTYQTGCQQCSKLSELTLRECLQVEPNLIVHEVIRGHGTLPDSNNEPLAKLIRFLVDSGCNPQRPEGFCSRDAKNPRWSPVIRSTNQLNQPQWPGVSTPSQRGRRVGADRHVKSVQVSKARNRGGQHTHFQQLSI